MAILLQPYLPSKINRLRLSARETPNRMPFRLRLQPRGRTLRVLCGPVLVAALAATGCSDNDPITNPDQTPPTQVTETYSGTLTVNGAITHPIVVLTAGNVVTTLTALDPATVVVNGEERPAEVGVSMGTWNGIACSVGSPTLSNDKTKVGVSLTGTATATGNYCVRIYDSGGENKITQATAYELTVTHF